MEKTEFWKSISLSQELEISGRFIFNGLRSLHEMATLYHEEEIFEVLYNLSVGVERLLKIAVILIEHDINRDQQEFERSLITHSHTLLLGRVKHKLDLKLSKPHNELLSLLTTFYKTHRYGRYGLNAISSTGKEKQDFHNYLAKHLDIQINDEPPVFVSRNTQQIKRFIGKVVGRIAESLYRTIKNEAYRHQVFTYEVRYASKAGKIFIRKEYDFESEEVLWRELLIFLLNTPETSGHIEFLRGRSPLEFDPELAVDYLQAIACEERKLEVLDELESLYDEIERKGDRIGEVMTIGDPNIFFDIGDDDIDDEE